MVGSKPSLPGVAKGRQSRYGLCIVLCGRWAGGERLDRPTTILEPVRPVPRKKRDKPKPPAAQPKFNWRALLPLVLVLAGIAVYATSFDGAFVFDDNRHIIDNPRIRTVVPPWTAMSGRRPILDLTLAANYAAGKLETRGYHAVNLTIHILAAMTLFGVVRRTLLRPLCRKRYVTAAPWIALATSLIWLVHPLQTQAVTYIVQRGEALMGLFYLLTLYCVIRGADSPRRAAWYAAAVASCALGMGSKAVMITAPFVLLLFDWVFITGSVRDALRRRWILYLCLIGTLAVPVASGVMRGVLNTNPTAGVTVGFAFKDITPIQYLATQFGVLTHYLRLSVVPYPLCLDHDWPIARVAGDIVPFAIFIGALLIGTAWAFVRKPWLGFAGAWFFIILAPTSSIVPIRDPAFEHRMYLPLATVVALTVLAAHWLLCYASTRFNWRARNSAVVATVLALVVTTALGYGTAVRNRAYESKLIMWEDVLTKRPNNARAHNAIGAVLVGLGRQDDAITHYREAVRIHPIYYDAFYNLGTGLLRQRKASEAADALGEAVRLNPRHVLARLNLAHALAQLKRQDEAVEQCRAAIEVDASNFRPHYTLGEMLSQQSHWADAVEAYRACVGLNPRFVPAHYKMGRCLLRAGRPDEAVEQLRKVLVLDPSHDQAKRALESITGLRGG